ncbi:MAG: CBS domain-containing protein [Pseudomonadales bacterium]|nr:CBS domain-containing protein [Pseudomonadales bacterium]
MITVAEIMTTDVQTLPSTALLAEVYQLMQQRNFRHVPIVDDDDKLLGLVSYTDVMAATPPPGSTGGADKHYSAVTAADVMHTGLETTLPSASARLAARTMESMKIGCLPVLKEGRLAGIITDTDFVAVAINLMEQMEDMEAMGSFEGAED